MPVPDAPHPRLAPSPQPWCIAVPDGACFDGGVDFVLGPYDSEAEAWDVHGRLGHDTCDCMAVPAFTETPRGAPVAPEPL
jgi:hypothetical protein